MTNGPQPSPAPDVTCKGITFLPVPEFGVLSAPVTCFDRRDLPDVPIEFRLEASRLYWDDGAPWPALGADVDPWKAKRAIGSWLRAYDSHPHTALVTTIAYALWVWSPEAAQARAAQAEAP